MAIKKTVISSFVLALSISCTSDLEMPPPEDNSSSSLAEQQSYCIYPETKQCFKGTSPCPGGGIQTLECPFLSSSSLANAGSSSSGNSSKVSSSSVSSSSTTQSDDSNSSSSDAVTLYAYCVFVADRSCLIGPASSCPPGGELSNTCPYGSSSSGGVPSSSSATPSSNSVVSSSSSQQQSSSSVSSCAGFVNGTERFHLDRNKPQFCDPRDNKRYVYVTIDSQTWMAEDLNYAVEGSECHSSNCDKYGRLYDWTTATTICPIGWHLPSYEEWNELITAVGGSSTAGTKLKAESGWIDNGNGTDDYGFSAFPGDWDGTVGRWWSSSEFEYSNNDAIYREMESYIEHVGSYLADKFYLRSVRCVKDN